MQKIDADVRLSVVPVIFVTDGKNVDWGVLNPTKPGLSYIIMIITKHCKTNAL